MSWKDTGMTKLMSSFEKQKSSVGHLNAPGAMMHDRTLKPLGAAAIGTEMPNTKGSSPGLGNPMGGALGGKPMGKSVQSPAQHKAVLKAAAVSANQRRKF